MIGSSTKSGGNMFLTRGTGSPRGCVFSPLFFSLYTHSCTSCFQSVKLLKSMDHILWFGLQVEDWPSGYRVLSKQLRAKCFEDGGDVFVDLRIHPVWLPGCDSGLLPLPGLHHYPGPQVVAETLATSWKHHCRGCTSCSSWRSSTCQRHWCYSATIKSILTSSTTIW